MFVCLYMYMCFYCIILTLITNTHFYSLQNNNTDQSLASQSSFISSTVSDVNSTCYEALANLTAQNVSLAGLEFDAVLRNVGIYSSCIYEYLSNCSIMPPGMDNCTTNYHDVIIDVSRTVS